jgi:hypothetical protein
VVSEGCRRPVLQFTDDATHLMRVASHLDPWDLASRRRPWSVPCPTPTTSCRWAFSCR